MLGARLEWVNKTDLIPALVGFTVLWENQIVNKYINKHIINIRTKRRTSE